MSNVQQLADEEAARAEAEPDADEEGDGEEVEGHPAEPLTQGEQDEPTPPAPPEPQEPVQGMAESDVEKNLERLQKEATRHANRVSEIMGEEAQNLLACPLCWPFAPGFTWPAAALPGEQIVAVKLAIGEAVEPDYNEAQDKQTCDECDGLTKTLTGAKIGEQVALPCRKCNGQGWIAKLHPVAADDAAMGARASQEFTPPQLTEDAWHRPPGHPHYGMLPAQVGV